MKGILLAGGTGSRLLPLTAVCNKHLLPVYDKPLIYYSLSTLMLTGAREIAVVTTPQDANLFQDLLGSGEQFGLGLEFVIQREPKGILDAVSTASHFVGKDRLVLSLGDNIMHGAQLGDALGVAARRSSAVVFRHQVSNPEHYAVVNVAPDGSVKSIIEKPSSPESNWVVPGLYFYPSEALQIADHISPSLRGELEITDLNRALLAAEMLEVVPLPRGTAWFDAGTHDDLIEAANFVKALQSRQGLRIASPEEIAWRNGWIGGEQLLQILRARPDSDYSRYLAGLVADA